MQVLRQTALLSALDDAALDALLAGCRVLERPAGTQIFRPSDPAERFFIVLAGQVKIFKLSARGDEQILHIYGPGETFGEAAMFARIDYPAFADTLEDTRLLAIARRTLLGALESNAELAMELLAGLSSKLREFNRLIENLSLKEVPARLAALLLDHADQAGTDRIKLTQSKRQIAAQIGTVAETLSRAFGKLKAAGLIRVKGAEITIVDRQGLEDISESP